MSIERAVPETNPQTTHTATVQERIDEIRAMRQKIPNFTIPESKRAKRVIASGASLPPAFIERAAVAITNSASLVRSGGTDPDGIRDLMSYADAYESLADELEAMASFVRHSVATARNEAGKEALTTYAAAQRLAKLPATADLAPYVADMRIALGKHPRKTKAQPAPAPTTPAPAPPPVTTQPKA
ncbi:MAG TPA: hypothetical protein VGQ65_08385 [Thermoanaerobaculia bacterium]|jgi:hypothetical protein|nr:hypothetical protein [Thermoanaerobaculia bacterium]